MRGFKGSICSDSEGIRSKGALSVRCRTWKISSSTKLGAERVNGEPRRRPWGERSPRKLQIVSARRAWWRWRKIVTAATVTCVKASGLQGNQTRSAVCTPTHTEFELSIARNMDPSMPGSLFSALRQAAAE